MHRQRLTYASLLFSLFLNFALVGFAQEADTKTKKSDQAQPDSKTKANEKTETKKPSSSSKKSEPTTKVRQINLSGSYVDLVQPLSFDPMSLVVGGSPVKQRSFYRLIEFLDKLREDKRYDYVVFDLSAPVSMNPAQLDELSRCLQKLSDTGKKTFAWLENAGNVALSIASNCDEIIMADFGGIDMPSMAMQSMFYRDAMDLIGVKASVVRAGDFKGAVEPYLNPKMSDHLREHMLAMLESMNDAHVDRIARGRGLKHAEVRDLQKERMLLPKEALDAGLVDSLAPYGAMRQAIKEQIDEPIEWVTPKTAAKKQVSMFQLMGQMMAGPAGSTGRLKDNSIVVLQLTGAIMDGKKASAGTIVSGPTVELIEKIIAEKKIKGAVVRINSPGGSATASEAIRQALVKLSKAKPTVISMGSMAASGGYWISCIDAPIYAERGTVTGSIGVFSMKLSAGALLRRIGIQMESIMLDESAGAFSLDRPWDDDDNERLQKTIDVVYDRFIELASDARNIKEKKLRKLAGGRVWSGAQAKELKLVDAIGGVDDCLAVVAKKAKLDDYNVVHRPVARSGLDLSELFASGGEEQIWENLPATTMQILKKRGFSFSLTRMLLNDALRKSGKPTVWLMNPVELSISN